MAGSKFVYVTYIRTTPEKLWNALIDPEFTRQYWIGTWQESEWKVGSSWKIIFPDGRVVNSGKIIEIDKPNKLVLSWRKETDPELGAEGYARCTYELSPLEDCVKFTVTHEIDIPSSKLIEGVSNGWPIVLAGLKSLMETGKSLVIPVPQPPKKGD